MVILSLILKMFNLYIKLVILRIFQIVCSTSIKQVVKSFQMAEDFISFDDLVFVKNILL